MYLKIFASDNLKMTIPERVCVGAVVGAFGIHGEIRVKSFCSDPKSIAEYATAVLHVLCANDN